MMNLVQVFQSLGPVDARNVRRDALLRWLVLAPVALALAVRWVMPGLITAVTNLIQFDIQPYFAPIMGFCLIILVPYLAGMVIGFLLLDQKDDGTLLALRVTPLSIESYLAYRLSLPMLVSVLMTLVAAPLSGIIQLSWWRLLLVAVGAAPVAPLFALLLTAAAQNKVQGLALTKTAGVFMLPPILAYFIAAPWQIGLGVFPTYWPGQIFWTAQAGQSAFWFYWAAGMVYQGFVLWLLARWFKSRSL
ncbi:MAG: hypothetical protein IPM39_05950 [Chloroflexi bacterium]|nr:hypothetical protein [Chloroflexota bacterium]